MSDHSVEPQIDLSEFDHSGCQAFEWADQEFLERCREVLATVRYKPESSFELRSGGDLMLTTMEYDRATGERILMPFNDEMFASRVQAYMAERGFDLRHAVLASFHEATQIEERHESREWISIDGEFPFDPHSPTPAGLHILVHGSNIGL